MASSEGLHAEVGVESLSQERRGPGLSLRQARERCRLTVASVANTLHLEQRVIEALEADDYGRLPPVTYVRGYLCAYARLVNLPVADVLQAFERVGLEERSRPLTSTVGSTRGRGIASVSAGPSWLLTFAFAVVLISGWMFWTQSQSTPDATALDEDGIGAGMATPATAAKVGAATVLEPAASISVPEGLAAPAEIGIKRPAPSDKTPAITAEPPAKPPRSSGLTAPPYETPGKTKATPVQALQRDPLTTSATSGEAGRADRDPGGMAITAITAPKSTPPQLAGALETLEVDATGESWVAVQDAGGQQLVYGLLERGDSRRVTGRPPFDITIGDATQVMLRHEGARVDLSPHTHGKVARFTLTATRD